MIPAYGLIWCVCLALSMLVGGQMMPVTGRSVLVSLLGGALAAFVFCVIAYLFFRIPVS